MDIIVYLARFYTELRDQEYNTYLRKGGRLDEVGVDDSTKKRPILIILY